MLTRISLAWLVAALLATPLIAQAPPPPLPALDLAALQKENLALRRQLLEQHRAIGQLQISLGSCNTQLADLALEALKK